MYDWRPENEEYMIELEKDIKLMEEWDKNKLVRKIKKICKLTLTEEIKHELNKDLTAYFDLHCYFLDFDHVTNNYNYSKNKELQSELEKPSQYRDIAKYYMKEYIKSFMVFNFTKFIRDTFYANKFQHFMLLLGNPGSGKTLFCRVIFYSKN